MCSFVLGSLLRMKGSKRTALDDRDRSGLMRDRPVYVRSVLYERRDMRRTDANNRVLLCLCVLLGLCAALAVRAALILWRF